MSNTINYGSTKYPPVIRECNHKIRFSINYWHTLLGNYVLAVHFSWGSYRSPLPLLLEEVFFYNSPTFLNIVKNCLGENGPNPFIASNWWFATKSVDATYVPTKGTSLKALLKNKCEFSWAFCKIHYNIMLAWSVNDLHMRVHTWEMLPK